MSFMSGIMMGAAIGRNIHEIIGGKKRWKGGADGRRLNAGRCKSNQASVENFALVSKLPGRRRYRIASLINNSALSAMLEKKLKEEKHISRVEVNSLTGSVLLIHSMDEGALDLLMERVKNRIMPQSSYCGCGQGNWGRNPVLYAANWHNTANSINNQVRSLTYGWFDLPTLLSVFFLIRGLRKMLLYGQRPSGPTMVWWALHMMKGRKH
ncbi:hypothetical protein D081_1815 [Anaerovibrio sp. JC8]|uniref:HMA2 domain-containing protein n=1 Tax=Anaerovibrio sp. JC8 TaxID=1240085 RepID=UPI000A0CA4C0|nr:hypothetical protein [Anaerovibrio sp. JC8]ORT99665.1 hypothetical protein D081_1815 [Anaerovibrio sp. JC8]